MPQRARPHSRASTPSLPADLRGQATGRLRVSAITYAAVFFFADFFPAFVNFGMWRTFQELSDWLPGLLSIVGALLFAALVSSSRLTWETKMKVEACIRDACSAGASACPCSGAAMSRAGGP